MQFVNNEEPFKEPYFLGFCFFIMLSVAHFRNWTIFCFVFIILFWIFYYFGKNNKKKDFVFRFLVLVPTLWYGLVMQLPDAMAVYFHEVFAEHLWIGILTIAVTGIIFYYRYPRSKSAVNFVFKNLFYLFLTIATIGIFLAAHQYGLIEPR